MEDKISDPLPNRKPLRLKNFDYSSYGAYFITFNVAISSVRLSEISGEISESDTKIKITLTGYGKIVESIINEINSSYEGVLISRYVIMPNHLHLIIELKSDCSVGISNIVGLINRKSNKESGSKIWQNSFYDHIIKDDEDYYYHCQYIDENPKKWLMGKDKYYS